MCDEFLIEAIPKNVSNQMRGERYIDWIIKDIHKLLINHYDITVHRISVQNSQKKNMYF